MKVYYKNTLRVATDKEIIPVTTLQVLWRLEWGSRTERLFNTQCSSNGPGILSSFGEGS